jgi:hypothetical protein
MKTRIEISTVSENAVLEDRDLLITDLVREVGALGHSRLRVASPRIGQFAVVDPSSISMMLHDLLPTGGAAAAIGAIVRVVVQWKK